MEAATSSHPAALAAFQSHSGTRQIVADYVAMTKPRVQSLLLWTTITTMLVAGSPSLGRIVLTCLGGALAAGGAGALNHYFDRDLDSQMARTAARPVASGRVNPAAALAFGICLGMSSFVLMALTLNLLSAALTLSGLLGYVFVYTLWLKRRTPQNVVVGGAAGAVPPLVGWASVTGGLDTTAWLLFAIVFVWTPPHFWALSILIKDDYERSSVPMLPVVRGEDYTRNHILLYTLALATLTFAPVLTGAFGVVYAVSAAILGAMFIGFAVRLRASKDRLHALQTYLFSLLYLALLFVAMVADKSV